MAFQLPLRSNFATADGQQYSYVHIQAQPDKATLLLLHGFPSHIYDWMYQIQHFSAAGFGVVAPDLLGYGESRKPTDVHRYRLKRMSEDIVELLDTLGLDQIVGIGHDFGATLLSRMATYHSSRCNGLVFLAVGPPPPGTPFDVDMINRTTKETMGFELLGYIAWIGRDLDAENVLEAHAEAAMTLMFCADSNLWNDWFHPMGKMKQFVTEDQRTPVGPWYSEDLQRKHLEAFGRPDGYKGATRWYRMWVENLFAPDEKGYETTEIQTPALFVLPKEPEASSQQQEKMLKQWVTNLDTVRLDSGHWIHLEKAGDTNEVIENFLQKL
jgi:soluble epoxide hydrolase/lipid-phosphate phosphatase